MSFEHESPNLGSPRHEITWVMVTLDPGPAENKAKDFKAQIFMRMGHLTTPCASKNIWRLEAGGEPSGFGFPPDTNQSY